MFCIDGVGPNRGVLLLFIRDEDVLLLEVLDFLFRILLALLRLEGVGLEEVHV